MNQKMAEREGFEPSKAINFTRFPIALLRPLGHLSVKVMWYYLYFGVGCQQKNGRGQKNATQ